MAVELTLKLVIENAGVGEEVMGGLGITVPPLTLEEMRQRDFFVDHKNEGTPNHVVLDEFFLERYPEDDNFFVIRYTDARDVPVDNAVTT
jgi:hypothetical protein